jgi:hypothetical protein
MFQSLGKHAGVTYPAGIHRLKVRSKRQHRNRVFEDT